MIYQHICIVMFMVYALPLCSMHAYKYRIASRHNVRIPVQKISKETSASSVPLKAPRVPPIRPNTVMREIIQKDKQEKTSSI